MFGFLARVGEGIANFAQATIEAAGDAIAKTVKAIGDGATNAIKAIPRVLNKATKNIGRFIRITRSSLRGACKAVVKYIKEHPKVIISAFLGIAAFVAMPLIVNALGFTAAGVTAGSAAAAWQASIGDVEAGSFFALLQSLGTWFFFL